MYKFEIQELEYDMTFYYNSCHKLWMKYIKHKNDCNFDYEDLEDVFQTAFIECWKVYDNSKPMTFQDLFKFIIRCRFIDFYRSKKREFINIQKIKSEIKYNLQYEYGYPEIKDRLDAYRKILTSEQLNIILLKMEGYTEEEISTRTGVSIRTIERRVKDIKETIKKNSHLFI